MLLVPRYAMRSKFLRAVPMHSLSVCDILLCKNLLANDETYLESVNSIQKPLDSVPICRAVNMKRVLHCVDHSF